MRAGPSIGKSKKIKKYGYNLEEKFKINYNNYKKETSISNQLEIEANKENNLLKFLKWKNNSCRYDIFFYVFSLLF